MLVFCWQPSTYLYVPCLWGRWLELQNNGSDSESSKSENVKKALQCPKQVITCFLGLTWWSWCVLGQALVTKQLSALTFQERKRVYKEALFCHFSRKTGICYTATVSNSVKLKTWNRDNSIQSILPPSLVNLILDMLSGIPWHLTVFPWHFLLDTTSLGIKAFPRLHNHIHLPWQSQSHEDAVFFSWETCAKIFSTSHRQSVCIQFRSMAYTAIIRPCISLPLLAKTFTYCQWLWRGMRLCRSSKSLWIRMLLNPRSVLEVDN